MRLALYQPDIPQNVGAVLRLAACFNVPVDVIEPCGFVWDDKRIRRAGMDYIPLVTVRRHECWEAFAAQLPAEARLVLLTTKGSTALPAFAFLPEDVLLLGRESSGVPEEVVAAAHGRVRIPLAAGSRSLNVGMSAAIALSEALRQTNLYPE